jgi:F420-dependent oxidoreductase-like protein
VRIGLYAGDMARVAGIDDFVAHIRQAADEGFATIWAPQTFSFDALTALAVAGREVDGIELGTAVVPTYPRHPMVLAQHALTTQSATAGRLALGIGLSHQIVIEGMFGYSFDRPVRHLREYLSVLMPLVHEGSVECRGETVAANGSVSVPGATPFPVLVAALGPQMLRLAGSVADGTITWMVGPETLASHVVPSISAAAEAAGRPPPRVVVGLPACVTDDPAAARERAARNFSIYGTLPSYRAMLDREGAAGPEDVAVVGDEEVVGEVLERLAKAGATDMVAAEFGSSGERERTRAFLRSLL